MPEVRDGMQAQPQLGGLAGRVGERLRFEPPVGKVGEGDLAGVRIDVRPSEHVRSDHGEEPLGILLAVEVLGALPTIGVVVAGLPATALAVAVGADSLSASRLLPAVLDVCHRGTPSWGSQRALGERRRCGSRGFPDVGWRAGETIRPRRPFLL